ncbi:MAG: hypothetical protein NVS2B16_37380 [Chloroflexota bacterium]
MAEGLTWSMTCRLDGEAEVTVPLGNVHLAALRQMGYELLRSPELLKLAEG